MSKVSIKQFYDYNNQYKELQRKANEFYKELKELNSNLDLEEVDKKCSYQEVKDIYTTMKYSTEDKKVLEEIESIMKRKKESEYPEINGVQYFKEINDFDFLNEKEKINLDKLLREAYSNYSKRIYLKNKVEDRIIEKLLEVGILSIDYILSCHCTCNDCSQVRISEQELEKYKEVWNKNFYEISEEEEEYSFIEIPCFEESVDEITSLEEFNNYSSKRIEYKFKKEPDLTLELL